MSDGAAIPSQRTAKKLPFKPTALRKAVSLKAETITDKKELWNDGLDLFRRSKEMEPIMAADRQRRMKKKQRQEDERRKFAESSAKRLLEEDTERGRMANDNCGTSRRAARSTMTVASELINEGEALASDSAERPVLKRARLESTPSKNASHLINDADLILDHPFSARLLPSPTKQGTAGRPRDGTVTPSRLRKAFHDCDDEDSIHVTTAPTKQNGSSEPIKSKFLRGEEDDEFAKYIRKAEERRDYDLALLHAGTDESMKEKIDIVVTSTVPGTRPCCFRFLSDKPLRLVRNTWLALQKSKGVFLDVEKEDDIVFTLRRQRVYGFSTLLSLGIRPRGNVQGLLDRHKSNCPADSRTRVHLEAWTVSLFKEMEREAELKWKRETGELLGEEERAPVEDELAAPEIKIRVILKARDMADVRLTVRPITTVGTLIDGFRAQRSIGPEREVKVWFDGDRLEEHFTMDEAEIDDLDTFEVHVE